jgi:hypothetical protein
MGGKMGVTRTIERTIEIREVPAIAGASIVAAITTLRYGASLGLTVFLGVVSNPGGGEASLFSASEMLAALGTFSLSSWVVLVLALALYNSIAARFGGLKLKVLTQD